MIGDWPGYPALDGQMQQQDEQFVSTGPHRKAIEDALLMAGGCVGWRVLDVGSGPLTYMVNGDKTPSAARAFVEAAGAEYVGLDSRECVGAVLGDMHDLPYGDGEFDLVFSRHSLEHALCPYLALTEMLRVSSRWVLVVVPADTPWCQDSPGHLYVMGRPGWENVFKRLGLRVHAFVEADITETEDRPQTEWRYLFRVGSGAI